MGADELIDAYLYELRSALRSGARERDRIVAEIEDHLWESWERYIADGLDLQDAARLAIARFGAAREVASRFPGETAARKFTRAYFAVATLFGSLLIAVGLTAMIALPVHAVLGPEFLFGPEGEWEAPARFCAERGPTAAECQDAWDRFFLLRGLGVATIGSVVGGMIFGAHMLGRRFAFGRVSRQTLVTGALLFALGGAALLTGGTLKYAYGPESGWNTWLPAGIASLIMSGAYALILRARATRTDAIAG